MLDLTDGGSEGWGLLDSIGDEHGDTGIMGMEAELTLQRQIAELVSIAKKSFHAL